MKRLSLTAAALLIVAVYAFGHPHDPARFYDVKSHKVLDRAQLAQAVAQSRIVLVGEHHTNEEHHAGQLDVIKALHEAGRKVAVGMEMFRNDSQAALDQWTRGQITREEFQKIYYDNWNFPWPMYGEILDYANQKKLPVVGLNVPREITRQVSRKGFSSLTEDQKNQLPDVSCRVDKQYMDYIRKAFGEHGHGNLNFTYFCEAQMVWDSAMATHALEFINKNPDYVLVLLAGTGHARKGSIPMQISGRSKVPYTVILPHVKGGPEDGKELMTQTDYLMMGS